MKNGAQLIRIARLRRFVGVFARGGDRELTADALNELARADHANGFPSDALRRARQAAQLLADAESGEAGVRALLHLGSLCLDTGAPDAAASAAELARDRAETLPEPMHTELGAAAMLLLGIAQSYADDVETARSNLGTARDLLIAARKPTGAALALVQQGLLDVASDRAEAAELCFLYARDFYRNAQLPLASVEVAAVAARAFAEVDNWKSADRWFVTSIGEADLQRAGKLAAEMTIEHAVELERAGNAAEALRAATDGARRCARLGTDEAASTLRARVSLQLARLVEDPREALQHVETVFEIAIALRDVATLGDALDVLVSGLVKERFPAGSWRLVERFRDRLTGAALDALAATAESALADLRH